MNWFVLAYSIGVCVDQIKANAFIKSIIGAAAMTLLDFLIEPVAIEMGFWTWQAVSVPLQNYLAWFAVSLLVFIPFNYAKFPKSNSLAAPVLLLQSLFFLALNVIFALNG